MTGALAGWICGTGTECAEEGQSSDSRLVYGVSTGNEVLNGRLQRLRPQKPRGSPGRKSGVRKGILSGLKTSHLERLASDPAELSNRIAAYVPENKEGLGELEQIVVEARRPMLLSRTRPLTPRDLAADSAENVWKDRLKPPEKFSRP